MRDIGGICIVRTVDGLWISAVELLHRTVVSE